MPLSTTKYSKLTNMSESQINNLQNLIYRYHDSERVKEN